MAEYPIHVQQSQIYGHPIGPYHSHFEDNKPLRYEYNDSDMAQVEATVKTRLRESYDESQRQIVEHTYARMNERMWNEKQGQLVDIYV